MDDLKKANDLIILLVQENMKLRQKNNQLKQLLNKNTPKLNNYDEPNLENINLTPLTELLYSENFIEFINTLFNVVYFNTDKPENHSIIIDTDNILMASKLSVFKNEWIFKSNDIIAEIIERLYELISNNLYLTLISMDIKDIKQKLIEKNPNNKKEIESYSLKELDSCISHRFLMFLSTRF